MHEVRQGNPVPVLNGMALTAFSAVVIALLFCGHSFSQGQDEAPPAKSGGLRVTFLPPPMEGTLSLGIYHKGGKLVRTLHAEAVAEKDFTVGLNGLITFWDGKDDAGNPVAPGSYVARGYCVGPLEVEGVAYHCNDWMADDSSPRIREISSMRLTEANDLLLSCRLVDGSPVSLRLGLDGKAQVLTDGPSVASAPALGTPELALAEAGAANPKHFQVRDSRIVVSDSPADAASPSDPQNPVDSANGADGSVWLIDRTIGGLEVKQFSRNGEFLRRLAIAPGEPAPRKIAASASRDFIVLLESGPALQRVRGLALEGTSPSISNALSTWKTVYSKTIWSSAAFASVSDKLGLDRPFVAEDKLRVRLLPNPLFQDAVHDLEVRLAIDRKGSTLVTPDGLPLCRITETANLVWAVMGHEGKTKAVSIFQGDGAVVEEFRVRKLANMMAFDAGEYEWSGK